MAAGTSAIGTLARTHCQEWSTEKFDFFFFMTIWSLKSHNKQLEEPLLLIQFWTIKKLVSGGMSLECCLSFCRTLGMRTEGLGWGGGQEGSFGVWSALLVGYGVEGAVEAPLKLADDKWWLRGEEP